MSILAALASRRGALGGGAALLLAGAAPAAGQGRSVGDVDLYGLIGKMTALPGRRAELIGILTEGTGSMPGCLAYVVAEDRADPDTLWITEIWTNKQAHAQSLALPQVRAAIARGRPLIATFETGTETRPVAGTGLPA